MQKNFETRTSLYQINEWPLRFHEDIYQQYPYMKLGVQKSVAHYANFLATMVEEIMDNNPECSEWVITAPPYYKLPAGANLISWAVFRMMLQRQVGRTDQTILLVNQLKKKTDTSLKNAIDFSHYTDYCKFSYQERLLSVSQRRYTINEQDFRNKVVIFINDINVTGASQEYMRSKLMKALPKAVHWLYIIDCDKTIGRNEPQLEYLINNFKLPSVQEFGTILAGEELQHTVKCINKIFACSATEMEQLLSMLNNKQMERLLHLIEEEGNYNSALFAENIGLLKARCRS